MKWFRKAQIKMARLVLKGTGSIPVDRGEVETVQQLCDKLLHYTAISGGLNDPRRIRAREKIMAYTKHLYDSSGKLEVQE